MRKFLLVLLWLILCVGLIGCTTEKEEEPKEYYAVYSFYGENEQIRITNGVIIQGTTEDVFYGGVLEGKNDSLSDIAMYSISFYTVNENEKEILLSNKGEDKSGEALEIEGEIGKISGEMLFGNKIDEIKDKFLVEVKITNIAGEKYEYRIPLSLIKIGEK